MSRDTALVTAQWVEEHLDELRVRGHEPNARHLAARERDVLLSEAFA